jgi:hypothetical protein
MTWLLAVVLRPLFTVVFFGFAAFVAYVLVGPLIPEGRTKRVLFDRSIKRKHPWKFALLALVSCYGVAGLVGWWITR